MPDLKSSALFVEMLIYVNPSNLDRLYIIELINYFAGPKSFEYGINMLDTLIFKFFI
jgi:hypothetical protein